MLNPHDKYTIGEYWKLVETSPEGKYEYIDGDIRKMTGESPAYGQIAVNIGYVLTGTLRLRECNVYNSDVVVRLANNRFYCPDVTVSCDPADWTRKKALESPTVVVEVHSPSTEKIDRTEKLIAYQQYPPIQEILYVDSRKRFVEHHHRVGMSEWRHFIYTLNSDIVDFSSIDVSLLVEDIYFKVYLELEDQ